MNRLRFKAMTVSAGAWTSALLCLAFLLFGERVHTTQSTDPARQGQPAWPPPLVSADDGEVHVLPVRAGVYMLAGAGGNVTVHAGTEGVLLVDTGTASMGDKVLAAVRTISDGPIRYIVNTDGHREHAGGNAVLAEAGDVVPLRLQRIPELGGTAANVGEIAVIGRASIIAFFTVFHRMAAPDSPTLAPENAWPDATYEIPQKKLYFNDEPVLIMHQPGPTDGNSIVFFRRTDVVSVGDLLDLTGYPVIDLDANGSVQAFVKSLNDVIAITVPDKKSESGTLVIPGHGPLSDVVEVTQYRDMVYIIRDRVLDMIKRGMSLEQVKEAKPTREYDPRYGKKTGSWTTDMFVEAVYRSLVKDGAKQS
jgi:glyoxylase-like metal-dependent hydrolase (beta-lactamase superfamily II)